ncbi:hypothetical protein MYX07_07220 [Patescibacteria group bacterium AH-259-L07]|nr:hypothetical protein [Patescibacteria group bacterium AH-259-L07]
MSDARGRKPYGEQGSRALASDYVPLDEKGGYMPKAARWKEYTATLYFGTQLLKIAIPFVEKFLGSVPDFRIEIKEVQTHNNRSKVPFNVEDTGLFVFFQRGVPFNVKDAGLFVFFQRGMMLRYLDNQEADIVDVVADLLHSICHDIIHIYQAEPLRESGYSFKEINLWLDGLAEYIAWHVLDDIYQDAREERSFWRLRPETPDNMLLAIGHIFVKQGIERRIIKLARRDIEDFKAIGFPNLSYFPKMSFQLLTGRKKDDDTYSDYGDVRKEDPLDDPIDIRLRYSIGRLAVTKIVEEGNVDPRELLVSSMENGALLDRANLAELKDIKIR